MMIPEIGTGFVPAYWYDGMSADEILRIEPDAVIPARYDFDVNMSGNYLVNISVVNRSMKRDRIWLFTGRRRLRDVSLYEPGEAKNFRIAVNVSDIIPRNHTEKMEDHAIHIAAAGRNAAVTEMSFAYMDMPKIFIAGDSTVTAQPADFPYDPAKSYAGWGQMLTAFSGNEYTVSNHSHSGLTTESFRSEGHYDVMRQFMKKGDICLFQFGHNDQKLDHLKACGGYRDNLMRYISEMRDMGVRPVLVTPLARNTWKSDGSYNDFLYDYALSCMAVGKDEGAEVIDLHESFMKFVKKNGLTWTKRYLFPDDYTHTNDFGAFYAASVVAEGLHMHHCHFRMPDPPEHTEAPEPPEALKNRKNPEAVKSVFEDIDRPDEYLTRAEAMDWVIKAAKYFPTNVYNDMYTDIVGHEWYAGTVQCAYQNGMMPKAWLDAERLCPMKEVRADELEEMAVYAYRSRFGTDSEMPVRFTGQGMIKRNEAAAILRKIGI